MLLVQTRLIENCSGETDWENLAHPRDSGNSIALSTTPQYQWTDQHYLVITNLQMAKIDIRCIIKTTTMEGSSEEKHSSYQLKNFQVVGKSFIDYFRSS